VPARPAGYGPLHDYQGPETLRHVVVSPAELASGVPAVKVVASAAQQEKLVASGDLTEWDRDLVLMTGQHQVLDDRYAQ